MEVLLLGGRRGVRFVDSRRSYPDSLRELPDERPVMDWILEALRQVGTCEEFVTFVGGYHLEKMVETYPELSFRFEEDWEQQNELGLLYDHLDEQETPLLVASTNVVFRSSALQELMDEKTGSVLAGMSSGGEVEPLGLAYLEAEGKSKLQQGLAGIQPAGKTLAEGFRKLLDDMPVLNLGTDVARVEDAASLARFVFGTKAQTLERLRTVMQGATVLPQVRFSVRDWAEDPDAILKQIQQELEAEHLVVRSSRQDEDGMEASQAGVFESVLGVVRDHTQEVRSAIEQVINVYREHDQQGKTEDKIARDEILVQPQLKDVTASGVVLSRDLEKGAPYFSITVDQTTGSTESVTAGDGEQLDTYLVYRGYEQLPDEPVVQAVIPVVEEVETLTGLDRVDVEFALDREGEVYLFQARPLVVDEELALADEDFTNELARIREFVGALDDEVADLVGSRTLLSNMADWNPAEMIGVAPRPLALSLYQNLITNYAWSKARRLMGYRDVGNQPLMVALGGLPYIDLRASFTSFVPATLQNDVANQLVNSALDVLENHPERHDKVEFEVMLTCHPLDFSGATKELREHGLDQSMLDEMESAYRRLTDRIVRQEVTPVSAQLDHLEQLKQRREALEEPSTDRVSLPRQIQQLTTDCVRYGTVPFSILARQGFIALTLLRSLRDMDVIAHDDYQAILRDIPTVASRFRQELWKLRTGKIGDEEFLREFGHLRPGTYDIRARNYRQRLDELKQGEPADRPYEPDPDQATAIFMENKKVIRKVLDTAEFEATPAELMTFIREAIPGRERGKFEFSRNVNGILTRLVRLGKTLGLSREQLSYLPVDRFQRLAIESPSCALDGHLERVSSFREKQHMITRNLRLPPLITDEQDMDGFRLRRSAPNFVTRRRVEAPPVEISPHENGEDVSGKIVMIRSADPGFDWIFDCDPAGLVTEFGGAGSHMAIRAAEFGLPAAIGCGRVRFEELQGAPRVELDCANQYVRACE